MPNLAKEKPVTDVTTFQIVIWCPNRVRLYAVSLQIQYSQVWYENQSQSGHQLGARNCNDEDIPKPEKEEELFVDNVLAKQAHYACAIGISRNSHQSNRTADLKFEIRYDINEPFIVLHICKFLLGLEKRIYSSLLATIGYYEIMFIDFSSVIFKFASKEVVLKHKYNYYGHKIANLIHYEFDEVHVVIAPS